MSWCNLITHDSVKQIESNMKTYACSDVARKLERSGLPSGRTCGDRAKREIERLTADMRCAMWLRPVLSAPGFAVWPASVGLLADGSRKHHYYTGGLAVHTLSVLNFALAAATAAEADLDIVATGAVWHDVGKLTEYRRVLAAEAAWERVPDISAHPLIGHTQWQMYADRAGVPDAAASAVAHIIASHHGRREWGALEDPRTVEAVIVHQADMLSLVNSGSNPYKRH